MKRIIVCSISLMVLVAGVFAQIEDVGPVSVPEESNMEPQPMHGGFGRGRHMLEENAIWQRGPESMIDRLLDNPRLAERAGISKEQLAGMKKMLYDINMKMIDLRAEMEKAGMEQARLMAEENVDEEALMQAVEKTGEIRTRMAKLRIQSMLQIKKALTPEQLAKLREIVAERRKEMGGGENKPFLRERMKERFGGNEKMKEKGVSRRRMPQSPDDEDKPLPPPPDDAEL